MTKRKSARTRKRRGDNEGTQAYWNASKGCYQINVSLGRGEDGRAIRRSIYGATEEEVQLKRNEMLARYGHGTLADPDTVTLGAWLDRWLAMQRAHWEPTTLDNATHVLKTLGAGLRNMRLQDVKRAHMRALELRLTEDGYSLSTRSKVFGYTRAALNEAIEQELIYSNPTQGIRLRASQAEKQARADPVKKALTDEQMNTFLEYAEGSQYYALFYTMFSLSLRVGEALGLRWSDIDAARKFVYLRQQVRVVENRPQVGPLKTEGSVFDMPCSQDLLDVLEARRLQQAADRASAKEAWTDNGLVFTTTLGTLIHRNNVNRSIRAIIALIDADLAKLPQANGKRLTFKQFTSHAARHTGISSWRRDGMSLELAQTLARHTDSRTTLGYRSVFPDEIREALPSLERRRRRASA
jgi:integrase